MRLRGDAPTIFIRTPETTAGEALRDRDASVWRVRVERLGTVDAAARG